MYQLTPKERFPIARQLDNSADPSTYYLRATIKDADGTTLETVNLTHIANHYYSKVWEVVSDPSGEGRFITINIKVYDDAGYTTLSGVYSATSETYLVQKRLIYQLSGGGGGADVNYKKIEDIIKKEVSKVKVDIPKLDISPLNENVDKVHDHLSKIEEKVDRVKQSVDAIEIPKPEPIDLGPVIAGMQQIVSYLHSFSSDIKDHLDSKVSESNTTLSTEMITKLDETINTLSQQIQDSRDMILKLPNILDTISKLKDTLSSKDLMGISDELKKINEIVGGKNEVVERPISFREKLGLSTQ